jgi:hypothetical protein
MLVGKPRQPADLQTATDSTSTLISNPSKPQINSGIQPDDFSTQVKHVLEDIQSESGVLHQVSEWSTQIVYT